MGLGNPVDPEVCLKEGLAHLPEDYNHGDAGYIQNDKRVILRFFICLGVRVLFVAALILVIKPFGHGCNLDDAHGPSSQDLLHNRQGKTGRLQKDLAFRLVKKLEVGFKRIAWGTEKERVARLGASKYQDHINKVLRSHVGDRLLILRRSEGFLQKPGAAVHGPGDVTDDDVSEAIGWVVCADDGVKDPRRLIDSKVIESGGELAGLV